MSDAKLLTLVLVLSLVTGAWGLPDEPKEGGAFLLPGRLPWGATALPDGEFLAPCEDQSLSVLDPEAHLVTQWRAPARFSGPVSVGPRGSVQLLAAPLVTGRFEILVWDARTRVLASEFAAEHGAEAVASAWSASGSVHLGWKDGEVEAWSPRGTLLWSAQAGTEVRFLLVDDSLGVYAWGPGRVVLFDVRGRESGAWPLDGTPRGVLQTLGGDLYCWTSSGVWKKAMDAPGFTLFDGAADPLGVAVDRQDRLVVATADRLRRLTPEGRVLSTVVLPRPALTGPTLDDRGRILIGTQGGLEVWTYDGRFLGALDTVTPVAPATLSDRGTGAWGAADWKVHIWTGFRWPDFGWPQDGGGPGRGYSTRRPSSVAARAVNWADDPDFSYFYQLAASGEENKQREVLDRFEAKTGGDLVATWPFANLILLKIARSGLTDLIMDRTRVINNWPGLRLRAYALLAKTAGTEDRDELMSLLHREYDPSVAAQGTQALARSGWDGDGRLMQLLAELQGRMSGQTVVADAVIEAARTLWQANGRSADPSLVPLVTAVFQGPYPRAVKQKAQKFFQDLLEAP